RDSLSGAEWRVRGGHSGKHDILESDAGLIWISPVLPMTAAATEEVYGIMERTFRKHGFDPLVTFTMITDRALCAVSNVAYDRRIPEETEQAKVCYRELFGRLMEKGYVPYRTGPTGFPLLTNHSEGFWNFARKLKTAID